MPSGEVDHVKELFFKNATKSLKTLSNHCHCYRCHDCPKKKIFKGRKKVLFNLCISRFI